MLLFDVTKASGQKHRSGLTRVSARLRDELGRAAKEKIVDVVWHARSRSLREAATGKPVTCPADEWFFTPELFSEEERPGFTAWLERRECRTAALFADAIPLTHPEITWPRSVARHPYYMRMLARFEQRLAISEASAAELRGYLRWLGVDHPAVTAITLGADGHGRPRSATPVRRSVSRSIVMVGILEPRKNQVAVLDAAESLWSEGLGFSLTLIGRVNPHFGRPIEKRIRELRRAGRAIEHHASLDDAGVDRALAGARFSVFPSLAEGCGLPVLESLWAGLPVVCSDLPSIMESAAGGGCRVVPKDNVEALAAAMRRWLMDDTELDNAAAKATTRSLPTWVQSAREVLERLN